MSKRQLRKRGSGWDDEATDALLDVWNDLTVQSEIDDATVPESVVYKNISNLLKERGFELSDSQCKTRMKTLKRNYRAARDNLKKSGRGRKIPQFYEKLDEILGHRPATSPLKTIQSGETSSQKGETKSAKSRRQLRVQTALKGFEEAASDSDSQPSDKDDPPNTGDNADINEAGNDDVNDPAEDEVSDTGDGGNQEEPAHAETTAGSASDADDAGPSNKRPRAGNAVKNAPATKSDKTPTTLGGKYQRKTARKSRLETTLSTIMGSFSSSNEEIESKHVDIEHKRLNLEFKKLEAEDKQREYELKKLESEERQKREEREHMLRLTQMMLNSQRAPQQVQPQYTGMTHMPMQQQGFSPDNAEQQFYNM